MARSKDNYIVKGLSGTVGGIGNFYNRGEYTCLRKPRAKSLIPDSEKRLLAQERFTRCAKYAKAAIQIPEVKAAYKAKLKRGQSAYNRACQDAFKPPKIGKFEATGYHGRPGDSFTVEATDDFKVASVKIAIRYASGELVEEGNAVIQQNGIDWLYVAGMENISLAGSKITATAIDLPGNETSVSLTL